MNKLLILLFLVLSINAQILAQINIDGTLNEAQWTTIGVKQNTNAGFGSGIDVSAIRYAVIADTLFIGVVGKLDVTNNNGIGLLLGFSQPTGVAPNTQLGGAPGGHFMGDNGSNANFRAGFEVDYMFAINSGNGSGGFLDAVKLVGARTASFIGNASLTGTPVNGPSSAGAFSANSVRVAFNNGGSSNQGLEMRIPFSELGVSAVGTVQAFAFVTSSTAFFSDVTVPGNVTGGNPGFNPNFSTQAGGPYVTSAIQLPVELSSFVANAMTNGAQLAWSTASETNNAGFEVQRSLDKTNWTVLGFVKGNGTTTEAKSYSFVDATAIGRVAYRLKQIDFDGKFEYSNIVQVNAGAPQAFELSQNYPNPFNPTTAINYQLPVAGVVSLKVYDVLGKEVASLVDGRQEAGAYRIVFNAANLASGAYFYKLQVRNATNGSAFFVQTRKMMLVK